MGARCTGEGMPTMMRKARSTTRRRSCCRFFILVKKETQSASPLPAKGARWRSRKPEAGSASFLGSVREVGITGATPAVSARAWVQSKLERALLTELPGELLRRLDRAAAPGGAAAATFTEIRGGRYVADPHKPVASQRNNVR
jgi:hypothetical protein